MNKKTILFVNRYGLWLAGTLTNFVIKRGYLPFVVIRPENSASKGLYTKLGFEKKLNVVRAILKPSRQEDCEA